MDGQEQRLRGILCKGVSSVSSSEGDDEFRKVEKVLAPFLRTLKKRKQEKADVLPTAYEELYLKRNPKELLIRLQGAFTDQLEFRTLMNETAELLKVVTKSKSVNLYFTDYDRQELMLCPKYYQQSHRFHKKYRIETGTYVAAHVAFTKEYVVSSDILGDVRFPLGIPDVPVVKSVICLPVITNTKENCIGVIELYRECSDRPYDLVNLQICNALTAWMGIAVEQNVARLNTMKELEIQRELSHLAELYFSGVIPFSKMVADLIRVTKAAVNAERGTFYVFSEPVPRDSENTLLADAYEEKLENGNETVVYKKGTRSSFAKDQPGIAGYAARTGEIVNVQDAYRDHRFDRKTDPPFHRTRSLVAFPVKNEMGVLAVLNLKNSLDSPYFRAEDIAFIESFLCEINLICRYYLLDSAYGKAQMKLLAAEKLLDFHMKPSAEEINELKLFLQTEQPFPPGFLKFEWDAPNYEDDFLKFAVYIFLSSDILEPCFEVQNLMDFLVRVKKSYRPLLYHNFEHAFFVLHFVFNVILRNKESFGAAEIVAILLAALCHDIDHSGFTNTFLSVQNDTVYKLYGDLCGEAHRCELILYLIQQTDLLGFAAAQNFKLICKNLKKLMMAFDLGIHFQNRQTITQLLNSDSFDWEDPEHRFLSQNMILVCSDYSINFKSFEVAKKFTAAFYKELYKQGDLEKSMGFSPLPMLDRNKIDAYPENQIILLSVVVLPVVEILIRLFSELNPLDELLRNTLKKWNEILQFRGQEIWRMNEALLRDKRGSHKVALSSTISSIRTTVSEARNNRI